MWKVRGNGMHSGSLQQGAVARQCLDGKSGPSLPVGLGSIATLLHAEACSARSAQTAHRIANSKAGKFAGGTVLIPAQHDERLQKPTALQGRVEVS